MSTTRIVKRGRRRRPDNSLNYFLTYTTDM